MSASLETRAPLLDHRVVDFALALPLQFKIRDGSGKWILKALLDRHIPRAMFERPKRGFSVPLDAWLRGPLADWVSDTLTPDATLLEWFQPGPLNVIWKQQRAGHNRARQLWPVLMLLGWLRRH
jgi:asparagine synthase (glutamine-hydrolysing)